MMTMDKKAMQQFQDVFCKANHVYCYCVDRNLEAVTAFSGSAREEEFIRESFPLDMQQMLCHSFSDGGGEDVIEHVCEASHLMVRGIAIWGSGSELVGVWIVCGVDRDQLPEDLFVPAEIRRTCAQDYEEAIRLLTLTTKYYMQQTLRCMELEEQSALMKEEKRAMQKHLRKQEVLTEILKMLESENSFSKVAEDILRDAGTYLQITESALLWLHPKEDTVSVISGWSLTDEEGLMEKFSGAPKNKIPFMTGRPYTVSSDAMMPDAFRAFMDDFDLEAGVVLPLQIDDKPAMYLMFAMTGEKRKWSVEDLVFLNDVKRILHTIMLKRMTEKSLRSSYASLEAILENAGCGITVIDLERQEMLYSNAYFRKMFEDTPSREEVEQLLMREEEPEHDAREYYAAQSRTWYRLFCSSIRWVDGRQVRLTSFYDITTLKDYQAQMERQANVDFLTGLYNRMRCESDIHKEIQETIRQNGQGAVCYLDLDDFKHINDGLGHHCGDLLLQEVGRAMRAIKGVGSRCYRVGGDEFVILLTHDNAVYQESIVRQITNVFSRPWTLDEKEYYCTMSMGIAAFPKYGRDVETLLKRADIALYSAKRKGKNRVEYYSDADADASVKRLELEKNLRKAVEQGCAEFQVYYQPLIDVSKPEHPCCGAEALIRWDSPELGFIKPAEFLPLAEYLGLIIPIGKYVLLEACKWCKYWNDFGHPEYRMNVNFSVVQLMQKDIVDVVRNALEKTELDPGNLTLEVTENLAIEDLEHINNVLSEIRGMGVRIALDDFGTGYSSLNHIRSIPIDTIKIDRCFINDIGGDGFSEAFVKTMSELAKKLDMNVCVEGVEKENQEHRLNEMKVDMIQGYLYDKPLTRQEFESKYLFPQEQAEVKSQKSAPQGGGQAKNGK